jgi:hypothetical protein
MSSMVVKEIRYRLRPGVEREVFLSASEAVGQELETIPGYLRRELLEDDDGWFRDVVYWRSREDAKRSVTTIADKPDCQACIALMDESSMRITHLGAIQAHVAEPS